MAANANEMGAPRENAMIEKSAPFPVQDIGEDAIAKSIWVANKRTSCRQSSGVSLYPRPQRSYGEPPCQLLVISPIPGAPAELPHY